MTFETSPVGAGRRLPRLCLAIASLALASVATADLKVRGIDRVLERNVRAFVHLNGEDCGAPRWLIERRFRASESQAAAALQPYGYYAPTISSTLTLWSARHLVISATMPGWSWPTSSIFSKRPAGGATFALASSTVSRKP